MIAQFPIFVLPTSSPPWYDIGERMGGGYFTFGHKKRVEEQCSFWACYQITNDIFGELDIDDQLTVRLYETEDEREQAFTELIETVGKSIVKIKFRVFDKSLFSENAKYIDYFYEGDCIASVTAAAFPDDVQKILKEKRLNAFYALVSTR